LSQGFTSHSTQGHFGDVRQASLLVDMEKLNLIQQKHTFTNQKKCTTTQQIQLECGPMPNLMTTLSN